MLMRSRASRVSKLMRSRSTCNAEIKPINKPIFIQIEDRFSVRPQLWIAVSSPYSNLAGCQVWISTDYGESYRLLGATYGRAATGILTAEWPSGADPETSSDLILDLSESLGFVPSLSEADEDNLIMPAYVGEGSSYELIAWSNAQLTAAHKYALRATEGYHLRRGVLGTVISAHAAETRFALLGSPVLNTPENNGIFKWDLSPQWIGHTLHFKFAAINKLSGMIQALAECADYTYTPA